MTALQVVGVVPTESPLMTAMIGLVTVGLLALVAIKLGAGRGWARWLFLVLYFLGTFGFIILLFLAPQAFLSQPLLGQASATIQVVLQTAALVLMFTRASREWFGAPSAVSSPSAL